MSRRRRRAVFAALLVAAPLLVVEGGFSAYEAHRAARRPSITQEDALCGYRLEVGLEGAVDGVDDGVEWRVRTNALGHRGADLAPVKPPGGFRVVCLGGSTTFGYGATSDDAAYPAVLQRLLAAAAPGRAVEVLNAGVPGWSSRNSIDNFAARLAHLDADLVLIKHNNNDLYETWNPAYQARAAWTPGEAPARGLLARLAGASGFVRWATRRAGRRALAVKREAFSPEGLAAFEANLLASVRLLRARGARPVLCTYPGVYPPTEAAAARMRFKGRALLAGTLKRCPLAYGALVEGLAAYNAAIRALARAEGVDLIDLEALVPREPALYVDYIHHDDAGLQVVAARVAQHIVAAGWLH